MRLLNTITFELHSAEQQYFKSLGYAILSHRWDGAEITFEQIHKYSSELKKAGDQQTSYPQLDKILGACKTAHSLGLDWIWIDCCCINKASATEESESINSMFKWYRDAKVCITYLSDVEFQGSVSLPSYVSATKSSDVEHKTPDQDIFQSLDGQTSSQWFSRLWCLQELLAPRDIRFYDLNWNFMGTKLSLARQIAATTGIKEEYLTGAHDFRKACIAVKMSWLADRTASREEDIAYGALGIFNITMVPHYGEGQRAFMRLQYQLLSTITDESIFAWRMPDPAAGEKFGFVQHTKWGLDEWGLLAPSPSWFKGCGNLTIEGGPEITRATPYFEDVQEGIQLPIVQLKKAGKYIALLFAAQFTFICFIPAIVYLNRIWKEKLMEGQIRALNCWVQDKDGKFSAVSMCLQPASPKQLGPRREGPLKLKRIRASELVLSEKYEQDEKIVGHGVVLQPELTYLD